jgi:uncharacterized protein YjbI with pentapeptide repeats
MFEKAIRLAEAPRNLNFIDLLTYVVLHPKTALAGADCTGMNFKDSDVSGFYFIGVNLTGADLSRVVGIKWAFFWNTTFIDTKLPPDVTVEQLQEQIPLEAALMRLG